VARTPSHAGTPAPNLLIGEYRVVRVIGRGAFGTVYEAVHRVVGKRAAIKVLRAELSADPGIVARFVDEARAVNRVGHPNIVDVFDFGELVDGRKYCIMELLSGVTLADLLETRGHLPLKLTLRVLGDVAKALDATHARGIVHRDLKPENIFLVGQGDDDYHPKLLDFGIAKIADGGSSRTETGALLGTPAYMAPEQAGGSAVDHRADIYALGVIAFRMLTGELPFPGSNRMQYLSQHMFSEPPAASSTRSELPKAIDGVLFAMLAKDPGERPAAASTAIEQLREACEASSTYAPAIVPQTPGAAAHPRRLRLIAAMGGAAVVAAIALGWTWRNLATGARARQEAEATHGVTSASPPPTATPSPSGGEREPTSPPRSAPTPSTSTPLPKASPVVHARPPASPIGTAKPSATSGRKDLEF
jgi:eukaryotic-like serine/threonine-protein kinase